MNIDFNLKEALAQLEDTTTHKCYLLKSCSKMAKYFLEQGDKDLALNLMLRASVHDISKFKHNEFDALSKISNDMSCMTDAGQALSKAKEEAIKLHWANNPHHPEYWQDYRQMSELEIIEMVCDWHARSVQFGTDLLAFVKERQEKRFKFPEDIYEKILFYCNILLKED